ncbi:MAG: hypothetical protein KIT84_02805 [Labilithrix sp.]|nr:hypothetical protein [Labilithrix sp.]MCW5809911.1 hypothetical protein [Labilithrix sp.]
MTTKEQLAAVLQRLEAGEDAALAETADEALRSVLASSRTAVQLGGAIALARRAEISADLTIASAAAAWLQSRAAGGLRYASGPALAAAGALWRRRVAGTHAVALARAGERVAIAARGGDAHAARGGDAHAARGGDAIEWSDLATGEPRSRLVLDGTPRRLAIAPDGSRVAVGTNVDGGIAVWDLAAPASRVVIPSLRSTEWLALIDADTLLCIDGELSCWELRPTPRRRWTIGDAYAPREPYLRHAFLTGDGVAVLRVDDRGGARIDVHALEDGACIRGVALEHVFPVVDLEGSLAPSPDRRRCAWSHAYGDGSVAIVALGDGRTVAIAPGDGRAVTALAWLDDARLVAGTIDGRLRSIDAESGAALGTIAAHGAAIAGVVGDGDAIVSVDAAGSLARHALASFAPGTGLARLEAPVRAVGATPSGLVWIGDGELVGTDAGGHRRWTCARPRGDVVAIVHDGATVAVATTWRPSPNAIAQESAIARVAIAGGGAREEVRLDGAVRKLVAAGEGAFLAAVDPNSPLPDDARPLVHLPAEGAPSIHRAWGSGLVEAMSLAPPPARCCVGLSDGRIVVIGEAFDAPARAWKAHGAAVVALHPIGEELLSVGLDGAATIWDPRTGARRRGFSFTRHPKRREGPVVSALLGGGSAAALSFWLPQVELFDLERAELRARVELPGVARVLSAPTGADWFAVACEGGVVLAFDAAGGRLGVWDVGGVIRQLACVGDRHLFLRTAAGHLHGLVLESALHQE